jgi:hypothetical protein
LPKRIQDERAARNQDLFRQVNDRVKEVNEDFEVTEGEWVCECADTACVERISLTMDEYVALRGTPTRFAVAPTESHVFFEVENVVEQTERFWVVEKIGQAGKIAANVDSQRAT